MKRITSNKKIYAPIFFSVFCLIFSIFLFTLNCGTDYLENTNPILTSYERDTLAVRAILDSNHIFSISVKTVTDSSNGRITALKLAGINLISVPSDIKRLNGLKYLFLNRNNLSSLPTEMDSLTNLISLNVDSNQIICFAELPQGGNLKSFSMQSNGLQTFPVFDCPPTLDTIDLSYNNLSALPVGIIRCTGLKFLDLGHNKLNNPYLPDSVKQWANRFDPDWAATQNHNNKK